MGWHSAKLQAKADLLRQIHAIEPHQRFHPEGALVETRPVPFYPGGLLIRAREMDWRDTGESLWYVKLPDQEIVALDGSVANIHHLNFLSNLNLSPETLPAYLKFRLYFGKDNGHRHFLMEDRPVAIDTLGGNFICACQFYEERKLYAARFKITPRGETETLEKTVQPAKLSLKPMPEFGF